MAPDDDNELSQDKLEPVANNLPRPISALHHDMLYEIFLWNANMFDDKYFPDAIRHSSQVCRAWRSCLLNSPDIWGRLIDLDVLDQKTDFWRDEILRRSRNNMLAISGSVSDHELKVYKPADLFFFSVLDSHWGRIRHLRIRIRNDFPMEKNLWTPLLRPAPNLQSFFLTLDHGVANPLPPSTIPLFSDHAPMLYHFTPEFLFVSLSAPWLSHLCTLHLPSQFSVSAILSALYSMDGRLESVTVDGFSTVEPYRTSPSLPVIMLPHLKRLIVREEQLPMGIVVDFLTHIHYPDQCGVEFDGMVDNRSPTQIQDFEANCTLFWDVLQRYLSMHTVPFFILHLSLRECKVSDWEELDISIAFDGGLAVDYYNSFVSILSSFDFSSVEWLDLRLCPHHIIRRTSLSSFSSVTLLRVDFTTLQAIVLKQPRNLEGPTCDVFPSLQKIIFEEAYCMDKHDEDLSPIVDFIDGIRGRGKPTFELDLGSACDWPWTGKAYLGLELEHISGLRVTWSTGGKTLEYICGSGFSDRVLSEQDTEGKTIPFHNFQDFDFDYHFGTSLSI